MSSKIRTWYDFLLSQMAAECYFERIDLGSGNAVAQALANGNNRPEFLANPKGLTWFTDEQADEFIGRFTIVHQWSDNPLLPSGPTDPGYLALNGQQIFANSGLSATLIRNGDPNLSEFGSYTLSVRSTEYQSAASGGDRTRDLWGADAGGIFLNGFALAQWNALEQYYDWLKATGRLPNAQNRTANATKHARASKLGLSERQFEALRGIAKGLPNRQIARELDISENTVEQHARTVFRALGVRTRTGALVAAARRRIRFD